MSLALAAAACLFGWSNVSYCTCCWYRKVLETPKDSVCVRKGVCRGRHELCDKQNVGGSGFIRNCSPVLKKVPTRTRWQKSCTPNGEQGGGSHHGNIIIVHTCVNILQSRRSRILSPNIVHEGQKESVYRTLDFITHTSHHQSLTPKRRALGPRHSTHLQ